ncbi:hypothetical protein M8013_17770 [Enterobacteriaceae bacterium H4N4]|uniref:Uncharacterized protein n=1 Tax=Silvania confinis TaxID=2926470 RepID=A0A9J6QMM2_9ENTR|nr:hypothetical protein [Silvania confinis]MCU6670586.1 hypothetical protein [Silvania confinis]
MAEQVALLLAEGSVSFEYREWATATLIIFPLIALMIIFVLQWLTLRCI